MIPHKSGGILAMFGSIIILLTIPFTNVSKVRNTTFRPVFKIFFWFLIIDFFVLIWIGQQDMNVQIFQKIGVVATFYYFTFFLSLPFIGYLETFFIKLLIKS